MKYRLEVENSAHEIEVLQDGAKIKISIDGEWFNFEDLIASKRKYKISTNGIPEEYFLELPTSRLEIHLHQLRSRARNRHSINITDDIYAEGKLIAPMPGKIISINCKPGDEVKAGQILVIFEAMKMENFLASPINARITSIEVKEGHTVTAKQTLVKLSKIT
jgi:biotin carboxyl carrier protein